MQTSFLLKWYCPIAYWISWNDESRRPFEFNEWKWIECLINVKREEVQVVFLLRWENQANRRTTDLIDIDHWSLTSYKKSGYFVFSFWTRFRFVDIEWVFLAHSFCSCAVYCRFDSLMENESFLIDLLRQLVFIWVLLIFGYYWLLYEFVLKDFF